MNIKNIVKLSFIVIAILVILIAAINSVVLSQIKDNDYYKENISKLVSLQENMNSLLKDLVVSKSLDVLDDVKVQFSEYEKAFEQTKLIFVAKDNFLDMFMEDIYKDKVIGENLLLLYKNEKDIEKAFDKSYDLQKEKIELSKKFDFEYPLENKLRKEIGDNIFASANVNLVHTFGNVEYYSKETLYQKRDEKTLQKWLDKIYLIKSSDSLITGIDQYIAIVKKVASYMIRTNEIQNLQENLTKQIIEIISLNRKVNLDIENNIEKLSSNFIAKAHLYVLILLGITICFIILIAYKVSKYVGLSVNEIEVKVNEGLEEITALNEEIEVTQKEVVFTMGAIGEQRSKETGNHVKRVASYTKLLALEYGLSEKESEMLKQASPMHDIGKVAIPDSVLNKPGRFDEEERKIMDTHANLGYEMLKGSNRPLLKMAAIVAREHHEKWDGSGYPQGKSSEDIHIYGRITALADVFDALGSDRVYKKAWDDEKIFKFFKEERGVHFDPKLVDIFFEKLDKFLEIREKFKD